MRHARARPHLHVAIATAALACADGARPSYTRVDGPAPSMVQGCGAVLVVFWATWCPPCVEELPGLRALARDPPAGLSVATYGEDEEEARVRQLFGGPPPPELGYRRDAGRGAAGAFGVDTLPAAFLVVDGGLVARFEGARDWDGRGMRRLLGKLASEGARAGGACPRTPLTPSPPTGKPGGAG